MLQMYQDQRNWHKRYFYQRSRLNLVLTLQFFQDGFDVGASNGNAMLADLDLALGPGGNVIERNEKGPMDTNKEVCRQLRFNIAKRQVGDDDFAGRVDLHIIFEALHEQDIPQGDADHFPVRADVDECDGGLSGRDFIDGF